MAFRHVLDFPAADLPASCRVTVTLNVDVERRTWLVAWTQPHPVYRTAWHRQLAYGFETKTGRELAEYAASRLAPERLALALAEI